MKKHLKIIVVILVILSLFFSINKLKNKDKDSKNDNLINNIELNKSIDYDNLSIDSDSGVLIGLKSRSCSEKEGFNYRTIWIFKENQKLDYKIINNKILVPYINIFYAIQNDDFYFEKIKDDSEEGSVFSEDAIYQYRIDSNLIQSFPYDRNILPSTYSLNDFFIDSNTSYNSNLEELVYVGNNYAIIKTISFYSYKDRSINGSYEYNMYTIPNLNTKLNKGSKLSSIFKSNNIETSFNKYNDEYYKILEEDKSGLATVFDYADVNNLYLKRFMGKWNLALPISRNYNLSNSKKYYEEEIDSVFLNIDLPKSVSNYDELMLNPQILSNNIDGFKDVVSSPNKNLLVVLTDDNILIFSNPQDNLSVPDLKIQLKENESLISNQWATGKFVKRWNSIFSKMN